MSAPKASVLFVIRSLEVGGAQRQLAVQAIGLRDRGHRVAVAVFYEGGPTQDELKSRGIPVHFLRKRSWLDLAAFGWRLVKLVRRENPDVVYTFMAGANVIGAIFKPFWGSRRLIWGVRASGIGTGQYDQRRRFVVAASARLASCPDACIANSKAGAAHHVRIGYPANTMRVIPNGIDTDKFAPLGSSTVFVSNASRVGPTELVIGLVARLDPMKDHATFLEAIARLVEMGYPVRAVCVGTGSPVYERALRRRASSLGIEGRVEWIGQSPSMPDFYRSLDVAVSASRFGEGFSNAVAEAMSCGVPCVVTNVGDSAEIVGPTGSVIWPGDAHALANGIAEVLAKEPRLAGAAARARIVENFGVSRMLDQTERLIRDVIG